MSAPLEDLLAKWDREARERRNSPPNHETRVDPDALAELRSERDDDQAVTWRRPQ